MPFSEVIPHTLMVEQTTGWLLIWWFTHCAGHRRWSRFTQPCLSLKTIVSSNDFHVWMSLMQKFVGIKVSRAEDWECNQDSCSCFFCAQHEHEHEHELTIPLSRWIIPVIWKPLKCAVTDHREIKWWCASVNQPMCHNKMYLNQIMYRPGWISSDFQGNGFRIVIESCVQS